MLFPKSTLHMDITYYTDKIHIYKIISASTVTTKTNTFGIKDSLSFTRGDMPTKQCL